MGTYRIVQKLATGATAELFLGKVVGAEGFEKPVAIKRILPSFARNAAFVEQFLREAEVSVSLQHANIIQVLDVGSSGGQLYRVMEFVDGENLRELLEVARQRKLPLGQGERCFIAQQVADGLAYAQSRTDASGQPLTIVHRDINPPNVMIASNGEVKLADFSITKVSDIFPMGLLLYELLAGHPLFDESSPQAVQRIDAFDERTLEPIPGMPAPLWAIVVRALASSPPARFRTARELSDALQAFLFDHWPQVGAADIAALFARVFPERRSPLEGMAGMSGEELHLEGRETPRALPTQPRVQLAPKRPQPPALPAPGRPARPNRRIGDVLVARGLVTPEALEEALALQKRVGGKLGNVLVEAKRIEPDDLVRALSELTGMPHITDDTLQTMPVPRELVGQVPMELCEKMCAVPVMQRGRELHCAVLEPRDLKVLDALKFSARATTVHGLFASEHAIRRAIRRFYLDKDSLVEREAAQAGTSSSGR